jgi:hypothetical protein
VVNLKSFLRSVVNDFNKIWIFDIVMLILDPQHWKWRKNQLKILIIEFYNVLMKLCFRFLIFFSDEDLDGDEVIDQEEAPVRLRRKRFIPRRDRIIRCLDSAQVDTNYDPVPAPDPSDFIR